MTSTTTPDAAAAAVQAADQQRYAAMIAQDFTALADLLSDDLVYQHSIGTVDTKASLLTLLRDRVVQFKSAEPHDTRTRVYGDIAIFNGRVRLLVQAGGADHQVHNAFTTVWQRQAGAWRMVHWQATPLPKVDAAH